MVLWSETNVDRPPLCACSLWCLLSSAPDLVCPALWVANRGCHTPPDTGNDTCKCTIWLEILWLIHIHVWVNACVYVWLRFIPSYSLVMYNVLVFSGHPRCPFPGFLVQTVLLRRPRLWFQLTTLMQTNTHTKRQSWVNTHVYTDSNTNTPAWRPVWCTEAVHQFKEPDK